MLIFTTADITVSRDSTAGFATQTYAGQEVSVTGGREHTVTSADGFDSHWREPWEVIWRSAPGDAFAKLREATNVRIEGPRVNAEGGLTPTASPPHEVGEGLWCSIHAEAR